MLYEVITGLTSKTWYYSAANQTSDGITPGDPVRIIIYQISSVTDRGYPEDVTL